MSLNGYICKPGDYVKVIDRRDGAVVFRGVATLVNIDIDDRTNDWVEVNGRYVTEIGGRPDDKVRFPRLCVEPSVYDDGAT